MSDNLEKLSKLTIDILPDTLENILKRQTEAFKKDKNKCSVDIFFKEPKGEKQE